MQIHLALETRVFYLQNLQVVLHRTGFEKLREKSVLPYDCY